MGKNQLYYVICNAGMTQIDLFDNLSGSNRMYTIYIHLDTFIIYIFMKSFFPVKQILNKPNYYHKNIVMFDEDCYYRGHTFEIFNKQNDMTEH